MQNPRFHRVYGNERHVAPHQPGRYIVVTPSLPTPARATDAYAWKWDEDVTMDYQTAVMDDFGTLVLVN